MIQIDTVKALREHVSDWRKSGLRLALVPTMGNLHAGHLALIHEAARRADRVLVSIFVNPLQFGPGEDFAAYPRTREQDVEALRAAGCHLLFMPSEQEVYPNGRDGQTFIEVPTLSEQLCGMSRPGHFRGVATVVAKLFNMAQPDVALFGEKDFQQLLVIRRMTAELDLPVELISVPTVREPDGLALSSRNGYLTADERMRAPRLYQALQAAAVSLQNGVSAADVEWDTARALSAHGLMPDYVSVRRRVDLAHPSLSGAEPDDRELVVLVAARLGKARLIDNIRVDVA